MMLAYLFAFLAIVSAQLPPINWDSCTFYSTQSAQASATISEQLLHRDHFQETIDRLEAHFSSQKREGQQVTAECAWVSVPAVYSTDPAMNGTVHEDASALQFIDVRVARYRVSPGTPTKQAVWHFAGGPGQDSVELFGKLMKILATSYNSDVYVMNLRGISGVDSSNAIFWDAMTPEDLKNKVASMSNHSRSLFPFETTDNDCRDLKRVIDTIYETTPKQDLVLVGHSYGTFFVHRFVQMYPNVAIRAILDSTCAGPKGTIIDMFIWANTFWFPKLMFKCSQDEFCSRVFGGSDQVNATITAALAGNKTCGTFALDDNFRFTALLALNQPTTFQITFAILKRFSRCSDDDKVVLAQIATAIPFKTLIESWKREPVIPPGGLNGATSYYMRGSEFGRLPTPSPQQLAEEMANGTFGHFTPSPTDYIYATRRTDYLPWSPQSPWTNLWAHSNFTKFFLISGEIDFNTPLFLSQDFVDHVPDTQWKIVPGAGHTAGLSDPTLCGFGILKQWVIDGGIPPTCTSPPVNFHIASGTYGISDWYGSVPLSPLAIGLIVASCLLVVILIAAFMGYRMWAKKKTTNEARLPLIA